MPSVSSKEKARTKVLGFITVPFPGDSLLCFLYVGIFEEVAGHKKTRGRRKLTTKLKGETVALGDLWLWLTLYQEAANSQDTLWQINGAKMGKLRGALTGFERKLSEKLHEVAMQAVRRQREPFSCGSEELDPYLVVSDGWRKLLAVEGMTGTHTDHDTLSQVFEEEIKKRSNSFMINKSTHRSSIMNRSRTFFKPGAKRLSLSGHDDELLPPDNPVFSKLVAYSQILQRKDGQRWVATIAVVTLDKFLHLFDVPGTDINVQPEVAFSLMKAGPRQEKAGARQSALKASRGVIPALSFNLMRSNFSKLDVATQSLHIMEKNTDATGQEMVMGSIKFTDEDTCTTWLGVLGIHSGAKDGDQKTDEDTPSVAEYLATAGRANTSAADAYMKGRQAALQQGDVPFLSASDSDSDELSYASM